VVGALVPAALLVAWLAHAGVDLGVAWRDLVGFRGDALEVVWSNRPRASLLRALLLVVLAGVSGVLAVVIGWFAGLRERSLPGGPVTAAVTALLLYGPLAILAGGSYWPPYLLQLTPAVVLAVASGAAASSRAARWLRRGGRAVVAVAVLGTVLSAIGYAVLPWTWSGQRVGEWLAASRSPGDTGFVAYGHPLVLETADMASPYPYVWSVPMRTFDPDQSRLRATLAGPDAPEWLVRINALNSWDIDASGRLRELVERRYREVAQVCGHEVFLRRDVTRMLAPEPPC
jgi:hypothetical protein